MQLSDDGVAFIARWEGQRNELYDDATSNCTIGIGHLVHEGVCDGSEPAEFRAGLSDEQVWDLFRSDATRYVDAVNDAVHVPLTQRQFDCLVSFAFNWGIGAGTGFAATSVLRLVNVGDFAAAAHQLVYGTGPSGRPYDKGLDGVRNRRIAEAERLVDVSTPVEIIGRVASLLDAWNVPVEFIDGWETRGRPSAPSLDPHVVVAHHTATTGYAYDYPSLGIVRDGRSDLPGPLAQFGIGRHTGTVYVIAGGKSNHAGEGGWGGYSGNNAAWGIEAENDGVGEEWGPEIRRSYLLLVAALCIETPIDPANVCYHREWSPYKIDPANFVEPADEFRSQVATVVANGGPIIIRPKPIRRPWAEEEDNVRISAERGADLDGKPTYRLIWARGRTPTPTGEIQTSLLIAKAKPDDVDRRLRVFAPTGITPYKLHSGDTLALALPPGDGSVAVVSEDGVELVVQYDERFIPAAPPQ